MIKYDVATIRADIVGGLVSSAVAIPLCVGFGMFAFVTLGDEYFAYGAMAGLISSVVAKLTSVVLGDRSTRLYAPRITTTFFLGLLLASLLGSAGAHEVPVAATLLKFFAIILLGGIFQTLFGAIRLGTLIKFAPHPVMAGFQNMAAVLLFLVQLGDVLGFDYYVKFTRVLGVIDQARPLSIFVAVLTFAAMWNARRIAPKVPPLLVGLGIGVATYYALVLAGLAAFLGPKIGPLTASAAMHTVLVDFSGLTLAEPFEQSMPAIVSGALALAVIASIDALLCAKLVSPPDQLRTDGDALLVRLGIANVISGSFGGITNGINIGPSVVNRALGARTPVSVLINALVLLAFVTLLFPLIALLPRVVLSAVIMVVAIQHIDPWTKQLAVRLWQPGTPQRSAIALDLGVATFVSILSIAINVVAAVFIGVVLAFVLFVVRMGRSNIRRMYRCDTIRSRRSRSEVEMEVLRGRGGSILVIELQGALFFGSAERLAQIVDHEMVQAAGLPATSVLLDLRRITEIDSTGARILADIEAALAGKGVKLALVLSASTETAARIAEVFDAPDRTFPDVDRAIEWAEDALLSKIVVDEDDDMTLQRIPLLRDFTPEQVERLRARLRPMMWQSGSALFQQGDPGSALFLLTRGRASVHLAHDDRAIRLMTFGPGAVFGELAILDGGPRSATVNADEELEGFVLSEASFAVLCEQEADVAIRLLAALGRELSIRLRYANLTIQQLET